MMKRHFNRTANLMMCHVSHKFGIRWIAAFCILCNVLSATDSFKERD